MVWALGVGLVVARPDCAPTDVGTQAEMNTKKTKTKTMFFIMMPSYEFGFDLLEFDSFSIQAIRLKIQEISKNVISKNSLYE